MSTAAVAGVDREALNDQLDLICRLMRTDAGAIELVDVNSDGVVTVRFLGMCTGCMMRPATLYSTIIPALMKVAGVTEVRAEGVRISAEAAARVTAAFKDNLTML